MNGKDYVKQAIDSAMRVSSGIKETNMLDGDLIMKGFQNACDELNRLKNKATLRTKEGTNLAFPVLEAAQNLEEDWENARINEDVDDLKWRLESFIDAVVSLGSALQDRTIIMT